MARTRAEQAAGQNKVREWYQQLRLVDQLLLNKNLREDEADAIRGGGEAVSAFMEVSVSEQAAPKKSAPSVPTAKSAPHAAVAKASVGKDVKVGSSFAALEGLEGEVPLSKWQLKKKKRQVERANYPPLVP